MLLAETSIADKSVNTEKISNEFNKFFCKIGAKLAHETILADPLQYLTPCMHACSVVNLCLRNLT
jgi:hypothetical protein